MIDVKSIIAITARLGIDLDKRPNAAVSKS